MVSNSMKQASQSPQDGGHIMLEQQKILNPFNTAQHEAGNLQALQHNYESLQGQRNSLAPPKEDNQQPRQGNIMELNQPVSSATLVPNSQGNQNQLSASPLLPNNLAATAQTAGVSDNTQISNTFTNVDQQTLPGQIFPTQIPSSAMPQFYAMPSQPFPHNPYLVPNQLANNTIQNPNTVQQQTGSNFDNVIQKQIEDFYQKTLMDSYQHSNTFKEFMQWKESKGLSSSHNQVG